MIVSESWLYEVCSPFFAVYLFDRSKSGGIIYPDLIIGIAAYRRSNPVGMLCACLGQL